jgi:predicted helicase
VGENDRLTRLRLFLKQKNVGEELMEQNMTNRMPVKAHPYDHQQRAYEFACRQFGLTGRNPPPSRGIALLMEMGTGKTLTTIAVAGRLVSRS